MKKILTLLIIHKDEQVLLGMKKRGFGAGKWNGFGGKVQKGESIEDAARRELFEEVEIEVVEMEKMGVLEFSWRSQASHGVGQKKPSDILQVHIFKATDFFGESQETEEMKPQWFPVNEIPFEKMWSDDRYWVPLFLENKKFSGAFLFDEHNNILKYQLDEVCNCF